MPVHCNVFIFAGVLSAPMNILGTPVGVNQILLSWCTIKSVIVFFISDDVFVLIKILFPNPPVEICPNCRKIQRKIIVKNIGAILDTRLRLFGRYNFNNNEFVTTDTELNAIANPANSGFKMIPKLINAPAAMGIPKIL